MRDVDYNIQREDSENREELRCFQLLNFCKRVAELYQARTGKDFHYLRQSEQARKTGNIFAEAVKEICESQSSDNLYKFHQVHQSHQPQQPQQSSVIIDKADKADIDPNRNWSNLSLADILAFSKCLKYSLRDEFLLIRYEENEIWGNSAFRNVTDIWSIYDGLLQECRSAVINLDTIEYVLLPFAKFRNLNESPEYSIEAVKNRIEAAQTVEFSEKLDGSFMQMRFLGDSRFQDGIIVSSSGTLNPEKSRQLADVLKFLRAERAEGAKETEETERAEGAEGAK